MNSRARTSTPKDEALDRLYRAAPEDFVSTRKALAAELREKGEKEGSVEIAAAHKPTATAWAVNQLALRHAAAFEHFTDAVDALRSAQRHLLEASPAKSTDAKKDFAEARATLNRCIGELQKAARQELEAIGIKWNLAAQRRIMTTLNTAPLAAPADFERVARGRLEKDLDAVEDDSVLAVAFGPLDDKKLAARATAHKARVHEDEEARRDRARRETEMRARLALEDDARRADREADRLEAEAEKADAAAKRAREAAAIARKKAVAARALLK